MNHPHTKLFEIFRQNLRLRFAAILGICLTLVTLAMGLFHFSVGEAASAETVRAFSVSQQEVALQTAGRGRPWINLISGYSAPTVVLTQPLMNFTVTNTNDSGAGSLRQAILDANANPGADTIDFQLGFGTPKINLTDNLPTITDPITINGNTGGATRVKISGEGIASPTNGLHITTGSSVVRGMVINRFDNGINLESQGIIRIEGNFIGALTDAGNWDGNLANSTGVRIANDSRNNLIGGSSAEARNVISGNSLRGVLIEGDSNVVRGNFIGTDATGIVGVGNGGGDNSGAGVVIVDQGLNVSFNNLIGGTSPGDRNLISGNTRGVLLSGGSGNVVEGNYIGTNVHGTAALGNLNRGVEIDGGINHRIGGTAVGAGNVIASTIQGEGILLDGSSQNLVQGNFIGTNAAGVQLGNFTAGVGLSGFGSSNAIGGTSPGAGNTIAFNGTFGVYLSSNGVNVLSSSILSNSIVDNRLLGIDLGADDVTQNDSCDADTGANDRQNFPILTSATSAGGTTTIGGTLNSTAGRAFTVQFFSNPACDTSGNGEGRRFIGSTTVTTGNDCNAAFNVSLPTGLNLAGEFITATATNSSGDTSEFSQCLQAVSGSCSYSLSPSEAQSIPASGGPGSVTVTSPGGCPWSVINNASWITINSDSSGSGTGTVSYSVAANFGQNTSRTGTIIIAGQTFTVFQDGTCDATISPTSRNFSLNGGDGTVYVNTSTGCNWTASSDSPWIIVTSSGSGSGDGSVTYSVAFNSTGQRRTARIEVAGKTFFVGQEGVPPTLHIEDASIAEDEFGQKNIFFSVRLSAPINLPVTVAYTTSGGTAIAGSDYVEGFGGLTFEAGSTKPKFISIAINPDDEIEPNETFFVNLSNPTNATIARGQAVGTIVDSKHTVAITPVSSVVEGDNGQVQAFFFVHLSQRVNVDVEVFYRTVDSTATAGSDYTTTFGTLTIPANSIEFIPISVPVSGDSDEEGHEVFSVTLTPTNPAITGSVGVGEI